MILLALAAYGLAPPSGRADPLDPRLRAAPRVPHDAPGTPPELSALLEETAQLVSELREQSGQPDAPKQLQAAEGEPSSFMQTLLNRAAEHSGEEERSLDQVISSCKSYDWDCKQDKRLRTIAIKMDQHARYVQDLVARNKVIDLRSEQAKQTVKDVGARLQESRATAEDEFYQLTRALLEKIKTYKGSIAGIAEKNRAALEKALTIYNTLLGFQTEQLGQMGEYLATADDQLVGAKKEQDKELKGRMKTIEDSLRKHVSKASETLTEVQVVSNKDIEEKKKKVIKFEAKARKKMKKDLTKMTADARTTGEEAEMAGDAMTELEQDLLAHSEDSLKAFDQKISHIDDVGAKNEGKVDEADSEFFGKGGELESAYQETEDTVKDTLAHAKEQEIEINQIINGKPTPKESTSDGGILPKFKNVFDFELAGTEEEPGVERAFQNEKTLLRDQMAQKLQMTNDNAITSENYADDIMKEYSDATKILVKNRTQFAEDAGQFRENYQQDVDGQWQAMKDKLDTVVDSLDGQNSQIKADQLVERQDAMPQVTAAKKAAEAELKGQADLVDDKAHEVQSNFKVFYAWDADQMNKLNAADFETTQLAQAAQAGLNNAKVATAQVAQANQNAMKRYKDAAVSEKLRQKGAGEKFAHSWVKEVKAGLGFADQQAAQELKKYRAQAAQVTSKAESVSNDMVGVLKSMRGQHVENLKTRDAAVELATGPLKELRNNADLYATAVTNTGADFAQNLADLKAAFRKDLAADKDVYAKSVQDALVGDAKERKANLTSWLGTQKAQIGQQAADLSSTEEAIMGAVEAEDSTLKDISSTKKKGEGKEEATDKTLNKAVDKLRAELTAEKVGSIEDLDSIKEGMKRREAAIEKLAGKSFTKLKAEQKKSFGAAKIKRKQTIADIRKGTDQAFEQKQAELDSVDMQMQNVLRNLGRQARLAEQAINDAEGTVKKEGQSAADAAARAHELVSSTDLVSAQSREEREALIAQRSNAMKSHILDATGITDKAFTEKLDHLTAGAESKLRAILADESLSDEEKKKAIEEYDKMTQAAIAALVKEQKDAEANIMNLERRSISWGADIDADLEAAEQVLSQEKMQWVKTSLHSKEDEKTKLHQVGGLISEMLDTLDAQSDLDPEILAAIRAHQRKQFGGMQDKLTEIEAEQEAAKREMALLMRLSQSDAVPLTEAELNDLQTQLGAVVEEVGDLDGSLWRRLESEKESRGKAADAEKAFLVYSSHTALGHIVDTADILSKVSRVTREKEDALLAKVNQLRSQIRSKVQEALGDQAWGMKGLALQMHGIDQKALGQLSRDELEAAQNKAMQEQEKKDAAQAEQDAHDALLAGEDASQKLAQQVSSNIDNVLNTVGLDAQRTALEAGKTVGGVLDQNGQWVQDTEKAAHTSAMTLEEEFAAIAKRSAERSAALDNDDNLLMDSLTKLDSKVEAQEKKIANLHYAVNMAEHSRQVEADAKARAAQRALTSVSGRAGGSLAEESPQAVPAASTARSRQLEEQLLKQQETATKQIEAENAKVAKYLKDHNLM